MKKVLKPGGSFIFDILNPDAEGAENWAILETYLGAEVGLEALSDWENVIKSSGAKIKQHKSHECFEVYRVTFDWSISLNDAIEDFDYAALDKQTTCNCFSRDWWSPR